MGSNELYPLAYVPYPPSLGELDYLCPPVPFFTGLLSFFFKTECKSLPTYSII
jgi:hypothetical protein